MAEELIALVANEVFYNDWACSSVLDAEFRLVRLLAGDCFVVTATDELAESGLSCSRCELLYY